MSSKTTASALIKQRGSQGVYSWKKIAVILAGTAVLSFGLRNIHQQVAITEGGVLGMILLLNHWFGIPPSVINVVLDGICYIIAFRLLGKDFLKLSIISTISLSGFLFLWESIPPMLPDLTDYPLAAAVLGGTFVGIGVGLVVRQGGATGGDDALALAISKVSGCRIAKAYLATDLTVLLLSLSYIPIGRLIFSLITVFLSSVLIGRIKEFSFTKKTGTAIIETK